MTTAVSFGRNIDQDYWQPPVDDDMPSTSRTAGASAIGAAEETRPATSSQRLNSGALHLIDDVNATFFATLHPGSQAFFDKKLAKAWILKKFFDDLLRYSIEDDGIDVSDMSEDIIQRVRSLQQSDDWLSADLLALLTNYAKVAQKTPIAVHNVVLRVPFGRSYCDIRALVPRMHEPLIPVSSRQYPIAPILEHTLAEPALAKRLTSAFSYKLRHLRRKHGITCLCFIQKEVGPVGALPMALAVSAELKLPISFYRAGYWPSRARLVGYMPRPTDRIAFVYDLLVTGQALQKTAQDLSETYGLTTVAGVVLFDYDENKSGELKYGERAMVVDAVAHYKDFQEEAYHIYCQKEEQFVKPPLLVMGKRDVVASGGLSIAKGQRPRKGVPMWVYAATGVCGVMFIAAVVAVARALGEGVVPLSVPLMATVVAALIGLRAAWYMKRAK